MQNERSATLFQIVADTLRESLRDGIYLCGDKMPESVIAREFSVSQNTVRDALSLLEQEGWVVKIARRGVFVRSFTSKEAEELYTLRAALEQVVLGWAMEDITSMQTMHLAQTISEARIQAGMYNLRGVREAVFAFHRTILKIVDRPQSTAILTSMHNQANLLENLRAVHDPHTLDTYADILTEYGELITHIRYNKVRAAKDMLFDIILFHGFSVMPVLDLVQ